MARAGKFIENRIWVHGLTTYPQQEFPVAIPSRFPFRVFAALTVLPAVLIGGVLWYLSSLLPSCETTEHGRLTSPDASFDLVVFSRNCGATTGLNTQAALIPAGDDLPDDAASFASVGTEADLDPRWDAYGNIELTLPADATTYRQDDAVAGIAVIYR